MTAYTYDENIVSDLYKDVYGCRPREQFWASWTDMSDDERQAEWDYLCDALDRVIAEEKADRACADIAWQTRMADLMRNHGIDLATAIRWDMQAEDIHEDDQDPIGYYAWSQGISREVELSIIDIVRHA